MNYEHAMNVKENHSRGYMKTPFGTSMSNFARLPMYLHKAKQMNWTKCQQPFA